MAIEDEVQTTYEVSVATPVDSSSQPDPERFMVDGQPYPTGIKLGMIVFGLCLGNFLVALDMTIISTAIPQIETDFHSLQDVGWYGSVYLLTITALQPPYGKVFTFFNVKWAYFIIIAIFELGSIICAVSKNSPTFIVGRAISGVGAAGIFQGALGIMGLSVPLSQKPVYFAIINSVYGIASCFGPILGGTLTDHAGWQWCFWINVPVGAVAACACIFCITAPIRSREKLSFRDKIQEIDLPGTIFLIASMCCLFFALQFGGDGQQWGSSRPIGLFVGFGVLLLCFATLQLKLQDHATIPPKMLKQRTILAGCTFSFFTSMSMFAHTYYLPFYFQAVQNTSATGSGIRNIPYIASVTASAIMGGIIVAIMKQYMPVIILGTALHAIGSGLLQTLTVGTGAGKWIGYQLLTGIGVGLSVQIPFTALQVVLTQDDIPTANAITVFFQQLGGALAVSISQSIFITDLTENLKHNTQNDFLSAGSIIHAGATNIEKIVPDVGLQQVIIQAYADALNMTFILATVAVCLSMVCLAPMEWARIPDKNREPTSNHSIETEYEVGVAVGENKAAVMCSE